MARAATSRTIGVRCSADARADALTSAYIQPMGGGHIPAPTAGRITAALRRAKDTTPCPDGVPYSAWRAAGHDAAKVLCRVLSVAATTGRLPPDFCASAAFFLPKGAEAHDDHASGRRARRAANTWPLALMDTAAKTMLSVVNTPIADKMTTWTPRQQQRFVRHRGTLQKTF